MRIGDEVLYKGQKARVSDKWNPHLLNPTMFKTEEVGYAVVTEDDGRTHILCKEDEKDLKAIR